MSGVRQPTVAVVGGGWAGCAAAVELARRHHRVDLYESAQTLGGRARRLRQADTGDVADQWETRLDNGQHILLGAYQESLRLMHVVGVDVSAALLRLPLQMRYPPGTGDMDFLSARLPAPLHLAVGLLRPCGLALIDKLALMRFNSAARWMGWRLHRDCSVAQLLETHNQTARVIDLLWRPLCLAALNTPLEKASAQVFLTVLRDSLGARRAASDMLIPRVDLSALFPEPAAAFIQRQGGQVRLGNRVTGLKPIKTGARLGGYAGSPIRPKRSGGWQLICSGKDRTRDENLLPTTYDAVILATPMAETARLLASIEGNDAAAATHSMAYEPILTCYLQYEAGLRLSLPFYALRDDPSLQRWGQFVFDRGHLDPQQAGLLAVVVSAASAAAELSQAALCKAITEQLAADFQVPALAKPVRMKTICEKRATFSCTPGLARSGVTTGLAGIVRAGDYVDGHDCLHAGQDRQPGNDYYPATIEAAVRSGVQAARYVCDNGESAQAI